MADDFSELMALAADLGDAAAASPFVRKAVQVTANKVKQDARDSASGRKDIGHASRAIDYELSESNSGVEAEIGYNKDQPAGRLGALVEFGGLHAGNHLAPSHDLGNALLNNENDFEAGLARAVDDALREAGL